MPSNSFAVPVTGTTISSSAAASTFADFVTAFTTCVLKDGTQTITANIPMATFILTGLGAGAAAGNSLRYEQGLQSILTTTGDTIQTTAANTAARLAATSSVAAHATTTDPWNSRETILTGAAVTFTDIADADYVGQVAWVYMNAAHVWTDGAVFDVQGGANYTAEVGDWVRINAVTVSTFDVTIFRALGNTRGSFTATLTGCTTSPTVTAEYSIANNIVTLFIPLVTATSNTTACTLTGLPAIITPATEHSGFSVVVYDSGTAFLGRADIETGNLVALYKAFDTTAFTNTGTKGIPADITLTYNLN